MGVACPGHIMQKQIIRKASVFLYGQINTVKSNSRKGQDVAFHDCIFKSFAGRATRLHTSLNIGFCTRTRGPYTNF